ncbi:EamA/RhaT family transporter, partial [Cupriavidus basilensis]|nr:EamA/RhaT family transporter [Cupriavidus basilensis]
MSILLGASVWGIAWFPYRLLAGWGLGGMTAAALVSALAALIALAAFARHLGGLRWSWLFV